MSPGDDAEFLAPGTKLLQRTIYHGWYVIAACAVMTFFCFGLGLYGAGVYLVALENKFGWPVAEISAAITLYFFFGASLVFFVGRIFELTSARAVVIGGALLMAAGLFTFSITTQQWQVFLAFGLMSFGWAAMSGGAINIILAPWFFRKRGLAVSLALSGSSVGGLSMAPTLIYLIELFDFSTAMIIIAIFMLAVLIPTAGLLLRPKREDERHKADLDAPIGPRSSPGEQPSKPWSLMGTLTERRFLLISVPFSLALMTNVGVITHQVAYLSPIVGTVAAGWAVSLLTFSALTGRLIGGFVIDRVDQRWAACLVFLLHATGLTLLAFGSSDFMLYLGCAVAGLALGNLVTLPGILVQHEFPRAHFVRTVSLVVAVNQIAFSFGPILVGYFREVIGNYQPIFAVCALINVFVAVLVLAPRLLRRDPTTIQS